MTCRRYLDVGGGTARLSVHGYLSQQERQCHLRHVSSSNDGQLSMPFKLDYLPAFRRWLQVKLSLRHVNVLVYLVRMKQTDSLESSEAGKAEIHDVSNVHATRV